jgi:hypothetical protein
MRHASPALSSSPRSKFAPAATVGTPPQQQPTYSATDFERSPGLGKRRQSDLSSIQPSPDDSVRRRIFGNGQGGVEQNGWENASTREEGLEARPPGPNGAGNFSLGDELDVVLAEDDEAGPSFPLGIGINGLPSPPRHDPDTEEQSRGVESLNLDADGAYHRTRLSDD